LRILLISVFGLAGTLARYGLQGLVQEHTPGDFPMGTLVVNLAGCLFLGLIGEFALRHISIPPEWRIGITIGFFGAFTTFSTFTWESAHLLQDGEWTKAGLYIGISLVGGLIAILTGMRLGDTV